MSKNIVILSGSPRKGGNTDRLAGAFASGAQKAGHQLTLFRVADLHIGGCRACNHCFTHGGVCVQQDDMPPILDAVRKADVLVFASPVYYFGVSGQIKLALDRFFALLQEGTPGRRVVLLITCGADTELAADPSIAMFRKVIAFQKWEEAGIVIAPGLHTPGEIDGRAELARAEALGASL